MSEAHRMAAPDRQDRYAAQKGWTPAHLPEPPPLMTPRQMRRFMHKLSSRRSRREDASPGHLPLESESILGKEADDG